MDSLNQAVGNLNVSDEEDMELFRVGLRWGDDNDVVDLILHIKRNDHEVTSLQLSDISHWNERTWRRLGQILGQSTYVREFELDGCENVDMSALCDGLKHNLHIQEFHFYVTDFQGAEKMNSLASFISNNPILKKMILSNCNVGQASIDILSSALASRREDTLECLDLRDNDFGDIDLDHLVSVLMKCKRLTHLHLCNNDIGQRACSSLAKLLESSESTLVGLHLKSAMISTHLNNECVDILAEALAKNNNLTTLKLGVWNDITAFVRSALLKLICDTSSIKSVEKSNHTLCDLGAFIRIPVRGHIITKLGETDFNLLHASLELNDNPNKRTIVRRKIIWGHARGDLNVANSSIPNGALPEILEWFNDDSEETYMWHGTDPGDNIVSRGIRVVASIRNNRYVSGECTKLDSVYRIVKLRPDVCG